LWQGAISNEVGHSNEIGTLRIFTSTFCFPIGADNHRLSAKAWGGPLQDLGVYCVNAARHVFKAEPIEVVAMTGKPDDDARFPEVDEAVSAILRFPHGSLAVFSASFGADVQDRIGVLGTRGQIDIDGAYRFEVGRKISLRGTHGTWVKEFRTRTISRRRPTIFRAAFWMAWPLARMAVKV
jgi:predicted dehydrogenase